MPVYSQLSKLRSPRQIAILMRMAISNIFTMKKIFITLFLPFFLHESFCKVCIVTGELKNDENSFIVIEKPIAGFFSNVSFEKSDTISIHNNHFIARIDCKEPVFATVFYGQFPIRLIVEPGDSIHVVIDMSSKDQNNKIPITIGGTNAKGHQLFYNYNYWPVEKYQNIWKILKGNEDWIVSGIKKEINNQVKPFKDLYVKKEIDKGYYELVATTITSLLLFESTRKLLDQNITDFKLSTLTRKKIATELFAIYSPREAKLFYGLNTILYAKIFLDYQRAQSLHIFKIYQFPDTIVTYGNRKFGISGDFSSLFYERNFKSREVLFGSQLLTYLKITGGEQMLRNEIEYFKTVYPSSPYVKVIFGLKRARETKKAEANHAIAFTQTPIIIVDSNGRTNDLQVNQYDSLKNMLIFVDIWATWCGPCLREMQFNYSVDSFLFENKIKRLYISIDNPSQKSRWEQVIDSMHLGGYHILASEQLQKFLTKEFGLGEDLIEIPRYLIIDKGRVVIPDAFGPSHYDKLRNQLLEVLNKNIKEVSQ